jgi:signal transduction histidine kinase
MAMSTTESGTAEHPDRDAQVATDAGPAAPPTRAETPGGMTLRRRLALLLGISTAVLAIAGVILFSSLATLSTERNRVVRDLDPAVIAVRDLRAALIDQETGLRGFVLTGSESFLQPYVDGSAAEERAFEALAPLVEHDAGLQADVDAARDAAEAWQSEFADRAQSLAASGDLQAAGEDDFQTEGRERFEAVRTAVDTAETDLNSRRDVAVAELDRAAQRVWTVTIGALFGLIAVGVVIVVALKRSVTDPMIELADEVRGIAVGDLQRTVAVEGTPELERLASDIDAMRLQILGEIERLNDANAAIEQQALELQRSNADLEQFAYVASHDLQEPLRKIAGFCQLLERRYKGQLDDRADEYIAFVVDGAQRMQDLINDLLAFSRVGRTTTGFVEVDLDDAVDEAVANLRAAIEETEAQIDVAPLPTVLGDRRLLVALFQNLIGNAVKFRGDDAPVVRVSDDTYPDTDGDTHETPGGRWVISVADNGIGIEDDYAEQIFTIFQRLHNRTEYDGTGIGLALAKRIIEYHDGSIWLDTEVDRGATFRFTLPTLPVPVAHDAATAPMAADVIGADVGPVDGAPVDLPAPDRSTLDRTTDSDARSPQPAQEAKP